MTWRRAGCALGIVVAGTAGIAVAALVGFGVFLRTDGGNDWLRRTINEAVSAGMEEGSFEIGALRTDLFNRAEIDGLRIVDGQGIELLRLDHARAHFDIFSLVTGPLKVKSLTGAGLGVLLDPGPDGRLQLANVFGPPSGSTEPFSLPFDLDVHELEVEGVEVRRTDSFWIQGGIVVGAVASAGPVFDASALRACVQLVQPGPSNLCVDGPVEWTGSEALISGMAVEMPGSAVAVAGSAGSEAVDLQLLVGGLDLEAIDPVASHVGLDGTWGGDLRLAGPPGDLGITGHLSGTGTSRGALKVDGRFAGSESTWGGTLQAYGMHVEDVYPAAGRPIVLDGAVTLDGSGLAFPEALDLGIGFKGEARIDDLYVLENADLTAQLSNGELEIENLDFFGIAGQLKTTGDISITDGPMNLVVTGRLDPSQLEELGITGLKGTGDLTLGLSGDFKSKPGVFDIRGTARMTPMSYGDGVEFESIKAVFRGSVDGPDFDLVVDASGTGGHTYGVKSETLNAPGLVVRKTATGITTVGPAHLEGVTYDGLGRFETADVRFDYRAPKDGELGVDAEIAFGEFDLQTFPGSGGLTTVAMRGDQVDFQVALDAWSRPFLRTNGSYDMGTSRVIASTFDLAPTPRLAWTATGPLELTVVDGGVKDATVALTSLHGNVDVRGDLSSRGPLEGTVALSAVQLDALAELFPDSFSGLSGVLDLNLALSGDASDPTIVGTTNLHGLWLEGVTRWLDVAGDVRVEQGVMRTDFELGSAGSPMALVNGDIPVAFDLAAPALDAAGDVALNMVLLPGSMERLENVTPDPLGIPDGQVSAHIDLNGRLGDPEIRMAGVVETALGGWRDPGRTEFDIQRKGRDIEGWASVREGLLERALVDGGGTTRIKEVVDWLVAGAPSPDTSDLTLWLDNMALSLVLPGLPADSVARAGQVGISAGGELVGGFSASGNPYTPEVEGGVHWLGGRLGAVPLQSAYLTVVPGEQGVELASAMDFEDGGLSVQGPLPLAIDLREPVTSWIDGSMELAVAGQGVPLGLLSVLDSGFTDASGRASVDGMLRGRADNPVPDLTASVEGGAFTYLPLGVRFSDLRLDLESERRRLKLTTLSATTAPMIQVGLFDDAQRSQIRLSGAANVEAGEISELSARLSLDDAWVVGTFDTSLRLDGDLRLSGAWPALNVDGDLEMVQGRFIYNSDAAVSAGELQPVSSLVIHRATGSTTFEQVQDLPFYADFDLDVGVDLNRNLEVIGAVPFLGNLGGITASLTQATVNSRLGGNLDLSLDKQGGVVFGGEVDVVGGSVKLLRTSFGLDEGTVVFVGGDMADTRLDLSGSTTVQGAPIDVRITGTAEDPNLTTTSAGYDDTQVLLMLLTGQAPDAVGQDQAAAGDAWLEAASLLATTVLTGSASGLLTVDPDGSVRVGAPWSATVFTQAVFRPLPDAGENRVALSLDWTLLPRLLLTLGAGDHTQWGDVTWEVRF